MSHRVETIVYSNVLIVESTVENRNDSPRQQRFKNKILLPIQLVGVIVLLMMSASNASARAGPRRPKVSYPVRFAVSPPLSEINDSGRSSASANESEESEGP